MQYKYKNIITMYQYKIICINIMDHIYLKITWHILLGTNRSHVHPSKTIYYYYYLLLSKFFVQML